MRTVDELDTVSRTTMDARARSGSTRGRIAKSLRELAAPDKVFPALAIVLFFVVWEIVCRVFNVPVFILPKPSEFLGVLIAKWPAILPNAIQTL